MEIAKKLDGYAVTVGYSRLVFDSPFFLRAVTRGAGEGRSTCGSRHGAEVKKEDPGAAPAQFTQGLLEQIGGAKVAMDTMWTLIAGMLVFFMNLGFATVESGLCRAKNAATILAKNFIVFAASSIAFLVLGWGLMFGDGNPFFGTEGLFFVSGADNSPAMGDAYKGVYSSINWTGRAAVDEVFLPVGFRRHGGDDRFGRGGRANQVRRFYIFTFLMVGIIYPITGHWIWGGGWLAKMGMFDFAGSTVVHSVGGWAALAGIIVLGPRIGKYSKDGKALPIPGHSMTLATLGVFVLWFGWFGFNPGSTMAADAGAIGRIAVATNTAASGGGDFGFDYGVAASGQARSDHDSQRRIGGIGGDHGAVRVCQHSELLDHRIDCGRSGGSCGVVLRQDQDRRSGRRDLGALGVRRVRDVVRRVVCAGSFYAEHHRQRIVFRRRRRAVDDTARRCRWRRRAWSSSFR